MNSGDPESDLLALLAHAELTGFLHTSRAASQAPTTDVQVALGRLAVSQFGHYERLASRLRDHGHDPAEQVAPLADVVRVFHERTEPHDWLEGLIKALVGDGIARDFAREVASRVNPELAELVAADSGSSENEQVVAAAVSAAIKEDPTQAGRLTLWARRVLGETVAQAQAVAVERDALADYIVGGRGSGWNLVELGHLMASLTQSHEERIRRLGLAREDD